jgi:hypothetical protein
MTTRTIISLPEAELRWLKQVGKRRGMSMASLVREAVMEYHARVEAPDSVSSLEKTAGRWKNRKRDALGYVESLRREWER